MSSKPIPFGRRESIKGEDIISFYWLHEVVLPQFTPLYSPTARFITLNTVHHFRQNSSEFRKILKRRILRNLKKGNCQIYNLVGVNVFDF